jgi:hypothetical protein
MSNQNQFDDAVAAQVSKELTATMKDVLPGDNDFDFVNVFVNIPDEFAFPEQDLFSELYGNPLPVSIADLTSIRI